MKTDVRVVAATNVDLMALIKRGKFREDLYYRLSTVPIKVSPLRERREDIYLLFRKFAIDFAEKHRSPAIQLDKEAQQLLSSYDWPGNIRELKNMAEQISALASDKVITEAELKHFLPTNHRSGLPAIQQAASNRNDSGSGDFNERELLYKLFFDMKKDLNDLKKFIFDFVGNQQMDMSNVKVPKSHIDESMLAHLDEYEEEAHTPTARPIVIDQPPMYTRHTPVQEETSLSLADKEKEMIQSALKKHKGRRKDAALDLGISERTLYRKIKEYKIVE
jgi:DNA-binding NtrC family response regulator